jgi:murein hydrolase activator
MAIFTKKNIVSILFFLSFLLSITLIHAQKVNYKNQDRGELEKQREMILIEIKETQLKLTSLQKDKNASLAQLQTLQAKLTARQALIGNINKDINLLENNINAASADVKDLTLSLEELKKQYAQLIRYTYKNRTSQSVLMFLFSARSFNDGIRKYNYVKQYREYRRTQAEKIIATSTTLQNRINTLNSQKLQKDAMLMAQVEQQKVLAVESNQKNSVVLNLKGQEKILQANISEKRKTAEAVNKAINAAIRREIELARKKAEEERRKIAKEKADFARREKEKIQADLLAKKQAAEAETRRIKEENEKAKNLKTIASKKANTIKANEKNGPVAKAIDNKYNPKLNEIEKPNNSTSKTTNPRYIASSDNIKPAVIAPINITTTTTYNDDLSDENRALSNSFELNKGLLGSPASGFICSHFGNNKHPVFNVVEKNYGIDIRTAKGTTVKSVHGGEVSSIFYIAGFGNSVMVNHGNYFTVYGKLDKVSVTKGQKISARTILGTVLTDAEGNNQMHFEVWKVNAKGAPTNLNPEQWIRL